LNIYEIGQAYGGPEEGGWWYTCGEPVESTEITNLNKAQKSRDKLNQRFSNISRGYSLGFGEHDGVDPNGFADDDYIIKGGVWGDTELLAIIEGSPAEPFPNERPRYE